MELWDAYDADRNKLPHTLTRGEPIPADMYHIVAEVLVRHTDGTYLLMQRAHTKHMFGGYWEAGAGGSVLQGETALDGAKRELFEETGIRSTNLTHLHTLVESNIIYETYLCTTGWSKGGIVLQPDETIDYAWLTHDQLLDFIESPDFPPPIRTRIAPLLAQLQP